MRPPRGSGFACSLSRLKVKAVHVHAVLHFGAPWKAKVLQKRFANAVEKKGKVGLGVGFGRNTNKNATNPHSVQ